MSLEKQIKDAIRQSGLTGGQICKQSGINKAALSRFMNGERSITLDSAEKLCELFNLELTAKKSGKGRKA